jgi:hypothetical protein
MNFNDVTVVFIIFTNSQIQSGLDLFVMLSVMLESDVSVDG